MAQTLFVTLPGDIQGSLPESTCATPVRISGDARDAVMFQVTPSGLHGTSGPANQSRKAEAILTEVFRHTECRTHTPMRNFCDPTRYTSTPILCQSTTCWRVMAWCPRIAVRAAVAPMVRSEEHTSELQSHSFISYAVFCLK